MKIIKLHKSKYGHYYAMFDEIPKITYEKIGNDYIGSAVDENGNIIFSDYLGYKSWSNAFAGRELTIKMKDETEKKIKDHWWDCGYCKEHGEFIDIGAGTLESLQNCFVFYGKNINKATFEIMLEDYFSREKLYEYYDIEKWCKLQYKWYNVKGINADLMVNKRGDFVKKETKERVYPRSNICKHKKKNDKWYNLCLFRYQYKDGDRLIKIEKNMLDVLMDSLPYTKEEIIKNCKIEL